ncbi:metallophosphoesterase family protein [Piscinibacter koreensis]|nr:metallophosphatase family protein [Schlegelella koreensis]
MHLMMKVAQFSDLHFSGKNLDEAGRCFGYGVGQAIERGVDLAVITGDSTDHALDVHSPAVGRLAREVRRLADHCPVLMLQGTFSHEPPGTLAIFPLLGGRHPVHVAERIGQVALMADGTWAPAQGWRFDAVPAGARAVFTCIPTVNKATVAAMVGAADAAEAVGRELAALLSGYAGINGAARAAQVPTIGLGHGTVTGCITEHGVPMAGFDHEFTTTSLFSAGAQAFMLGHIHKHQSWDDAGRVVAYAGSIGRFHHGELDAKGFLLWEVGAAIARFELIETPARRTVDLVFEGLPDLEEITRAATDLGVAGAHVRVRWQVGEEERAGIDREAIKRALGDAADVQLEGRVVPVVRSRAAGISRAATLQEKVRVWAKATGCTDGPLIERLNSLVDRDPADIAAGILQVDEASADVDASLFRSTPQAKPLPIQAAREPDQPAELELF